MAAPATSRVCVRQSREEVEKLIEEIEETTQCKYVSVYNDKNFNDMSWQPSVKHRVFFEKKNDGKSPTISFTGMPFIFIGSMSFECHLGKDRARRKKERYAQKDMSGGSVPRKKRYLAQDTKKIGCPAELKVTRVAVFPNHKILKDSVWERKRAGQALRSILQETQSLAWENTYYVLVPRLEDHVGHPVLGEVACAQEAANPVVEERIKELLRQGVRSVSEMRRHIREFVKDNLYSGDKPLPLTRYRYYTLHQNLRNIMKMAKEAEDRSSDDQEKLQVLVKTWSENDPDDKVFIRPRCEGEDFLLCYQATWQQRLLNLYGRDVCLLEHETTQSEQRVYFLWVRTNVCYVAVAVFVVQRETKEAVSEALELLKAWNDGWSPDFFMVDFSPTEIDAVESVFTGCRAVLTHFHLEKAWSEWIKEAEHEVQNQSVALASLRKIAAADTPQTYEKALEELQGSEEWARNPLFQKWFQTTWLPVHKRWATAFHEESLQLNLITNHGLERLNDTFKDTHLEGNTSTISETMTLVVCDFLPKLQKKYIQLNVQDSSGDSDSLPTFLLNRPRDMVEHIKDQMAADAGPQHITEASPGIFKVTSEADKGSSLVTLGSSSTFPSCSCDDWKRTRLPCRHFCAGFKAGWKWDDLCPQYKNSPLLNLDLHCYSANPPASKAEEESLQVKDDIQSVEQMSKSEFDGSKDVNGEDSPDYEHRTKTLVQNESQTAQALPETTKTKETVSRARRRCAELLKALSDTILFVDHEDFLRNLEMTLEDAATEVKKHTPHDKRMAINNITKRRKRRNTGATRDAAQQTKRAKHSYVNLLRESAKITRKHKNEKESEPTNNSKAQTDTPHLQGKSNAVVQVDAETPERPVTGTWCKIGATVLTRADEDALLTGQWLNAKLINASQCLLREEFPFVEGLTDSDRLLTDTAQVPPAADVVQIHPVGQHWLVSAAVRHQVQVYESRPPGSCTALPLRQQLASVYRRFCRGPDQVIDVHIKCTQTAQQEVDSGLSAIANAVSLASGIDPADIQYNQNVMRTHLHTCLTKRKVKMFPHTQRKSGWIMAERHEILSRYCICLQYKKGAVMVQCDKCRGWYHSSCVNPPASIRSQIMIRNDFCPQCG